ncbi:MAG: DNA/RNA helicase domain-containing protein [Cyanobium sp.]
MRAKLVKIGYSRGLRLAKPLLEQAGLSDEVEIQAAPGVLTIRPVAAPRAVYRAKLTGSLQKNEYDNLFCGSACFVGAPEGHYDALIVDESHRLMTKTIYNKEGENQIKEIIHASKLIVFFLDEDQRVTFDDNRIAEACGYGAHPRSSSGASTTRPSCIAINCHRSSASPRRVSRLRLHDVHLAKVPKNKIRT